MHYHTFWNNCSWYEPCELFHPIICLWLSPGTTEIKVYWRQRAPRLWQISAPSKMCCTSRPGSLGNSLNHFLCGRIIHLELIRGGEHWLPCCVLWKLLPISPASWLLLHAGSPCCPAFLREKMHLREKIHLPRLSLSLAINKSLVGYFLYFT